MIRRTGVVVAIVGSLLILSAPAGVRAQSTTGVEQVASASASAVAEVEANRAAVIREVIERWRGQFQPANPSLNIMGGEAELGAALEGASAEKLLAANRAGTFDEALTALRGRWEGPSVIPLEPGAPIPNQLGSTTSDLVFTPVTPCRIIDTRVATNPALLGRIGPNDGKQFSVSLANYATQGGNAGSCGITIAPAAVAINVTSTDQTGLGNLRVIQTGGGVPNVSLVNYQPGVNIANAAVVRSAGSLGNANIFVYSANSASQVVVDIMGYFAAPEATALQNVKMQVASITIANGTTGSVTSPVCPAGYTITGGGGGFTSQVAGAVVLFMHPFGTDASPFTFYNCGGWNISGGNLSFTCTSVCSRVPGR